MVRRAMRQSVFYLHHIWIATAVAGFIGLIDVIQYADAKRTSMSTNLTILASLDASGTWFAFSILFTFISAAIMRRRLKRGTIRRMGVRWQRVVAGLAIPFLVLSYLLRDIDRLSQAPRHHPSSKVEVRALRASKLAFIPAIALVVFAQVASPLDNAFLGLTYVTEGPAAIDDPARYVLKWLRPELFIDSLDKYSKYIWIGAVSYFLGAINTAENPEELTVIDPQVREVKSGVSDYADATEIQYDRYHIRPVAASLARRYRFDNSPVHHL